MDQDLLKLFTKLKVLGKKLLNLELDIMQLSSDRNYAAEALKKLSNADDPELVAAAIEVMDRLGLLNAKNNDAPKEEDVSAAGKYIHTLR